ncbi:MAG: NPCBM/NEW2 domain-containing protein [Planctomycetales bacterium]|nr:NPCBM/NEW2 domain-containing protein [Planctomycetales bacterium]
MTGRRMSPPIANFQRLLAAVVALAVVFTEASAFAQYPLLPLTTVDRGVEQAEWLGTDPAGKLLFAAAKTGDQTEGEPVVVAAGDLVSWGHPRDRGRGTYVVLVDGGMLAVETVSTDAENLQCTSVAFGPRTFALPNVRGIVFSGSGGASARARMFDAVLRGTQGDRDRLVTAGDDELTGTINSIDFRGVTMQTSLGPVVMELGKTAYVVFNPALAAPVAASKPGEVRTLVGLTDGSQLVCSGITEDADRVQLKLAAGPEAGAGPPWELGRSEAYFVQTVTGGATTYLSDLEPAGYRHVPYLERSWPYATDRSVGGGPLRAGGKTYLKGIAMHSTARLSFEILPGKKRFAASIAIDDEAQGRGSVTFRVFVDKEQRFQSEVVRGGELPKPIEVDVSGGSTLSLVVDFADHGDEQDHADWLNARFLP